MPEITLPAAGGCRCGALRLEITAPPLFSAACHCTGCQKMSGGAFSLSLAVPANGFAVTEGDPVEGGMKQGIAHMHCPACLSWVFTRPPGAHFVNVRTSMLDAPPQEVPFVETWLSEAMPFARLGAPHGYDRFPGEADFQPLLEAYASARA